MKNQAFLRLLVVAIILTLILPVLGPVLAEETIEVAPTEEPVLAENVEAVQAPVVAEAPAVVAAALASSVTSPANNSTFNVGQAITFTAAGSGGTPPYAYTWNFGDGSEAFGQSHAKTYTTAGTRTVTLGIHDFNQVVNSATLTVNIVDNVTPGPDPVETLTISNIRVTDIAATSAIIRWTTNRAASSRVIYDNTSHASIAGQSAPNFGYANSTATSDTTTKVIEHAVTVSGLAASTTYYFRVISQ